MEQETYPRIGKLEVFKDSKAWCSFEKTIGSPPDDEHITFRAAPMRRFKPVGLMLFGISKGMTVQCLIQNCDNLDVAAYGTLPAQIFARAHSYDQLYRMLKEGEANLNEWADFMVVNVGNIIVLRLTAPRPGMLHDTQAAMWGIAQTF